MTHAYYRWHITTDVTDTHHRFNMEVWPLWQFSVAAKTANSALLLAQQEIRHAKPRWRRAAVVIQVSRCEKIAATEE